MGFLLPAQFLIPRRKVDNSAKLEFVTALEVSNEEFAKLDALRMSDGWVEFRENELDESKIPSEDAPTDAKSRSDRLRSVLYVLYLKKHPDGKHFDSWRDQYMDEIIARVKDKIDEL